MHCVYDLETYPNFFSMGIKPIGQPGGVFEISDRRNDANYMRQYLRPVTRMIGFNNFFFDWQVLRHFINNPNATAFELYLVADRLINGDRDDNFKRTDWNPIIEQVDLYKIHHFDNKAKRTSLKHLQFAMRSRSLEDLPIAPGTILTPEQMDITRAYNMHDVEETERFYEHTKEMIEFRETLGPKFLNYSDGKIGKTFFTDRLEEQTPGITKNQDGYGPRQTRRRSGVNIGDILLPNINFQFSKNLQRTLDWLKTQHVPEYGADLKTTVNGVTIGLGGLHGSLHDVVIRKEPGWTILDLDVTSYYPSLAIVNRFFPEHLGESFCDIYADLKTERLKHKKGTLENRTLKLALNVPYGESNNEYSCFRDYKYLLSITMNGQLQLCMLMEQLLTRVTTCELIQINTDGLTIRFRDEYRDQVDQIATWWEGYTGLDLESVEYDLMAIRDVNAYLARTTDGKIKRKGPYCHDRDDQAELPWHKDHSFLVVPKAAEQYFTHGTPVADFIRNHTDPFDFLGYVKVARTHRLETADGRQLQRITRYYAATDGDEFYKIMPPLANAKDPAKERRNRVNVGWLCRECNLFEGDLTNLDYDFYISEAEKLIY